MKNFNLYIPEKYATSNYQKVAEGIYLTKDPYGYNEQIYVTSLTFEQETMLYGEEDGSPQNITQTPFEALLDEFCVAVTDFYDELNEKSKSICYQEFGSPDLENIQRLQEMIGKRIFAVPYEEDGEEYYKVVIQPTK